MARGAEPRDDVADHDPLEELAGRAQLRTEPQRGSEPTQLSPARSVATAAGRCGDGVPFWVQMTVARWLPAPTVRGDGDHSHACGWCGAVLFGHLDEPYLIRSLTLRCPVCERHSRAPAP